MIILGIDPGIALCGFGVIKSENKNFALVDHGCVVTHAKDAYPDRLKKIFDRCNALITQYHPNSIILEKIFFAKNSKTAIIIGEVRGILILLSIQHKIPLKEFTPLEVKKSITSYGRASKQQMQKMVSRLLGLDYIIKPDDACDAVALALVYAFQNKS